MPWLLQDGSTVVFMTSGDELFFDYEQVNGTYKYVPRFFVQDTLVQVGNQFILTDTMGDQLCFNDFSVTPNGSTGQPGQFISLTNPAGIVVDQVTAYTSSGDIAAITAVAASPRKRTCTPTCLAAIPTPVCWPNATLSQQTTRNGPWSIVQQVVYGYYTGCQPFGNRGDLMTATIENGSGQVLDEDYYRDYTPGETNGQVNDLMYDFDTAFFARLKGRGVQSVHGQQQRGRPLCRRLLPVRYRHQPRDRGRLCKGRAAPAARTRWVPARVLIPIPMQPVSFLPVTITGRPRPLKPCRTATRTTSSPMPTARSC